MQLSLSDQEVVPNPGALRSYRTLTCNAQTVQVMVGGRNTTNPPGFFSEVHGASSQSPPYRFPPLTFATPRVFPVYITECRNGRIGKDIDDFAVLRVNFKPLL